ncbi:Plant UBX domain-containing protein 4 [Ranunculus cassubicifolius]
MASVGRRPETSFDLFLSKGMFTAKHYPGRKGSGSSGRMLDHTVFFKDDVFTLDGIEYRRIDDPKWAPFLKSLVKSEVPDEFEDGMHYIHVVRLGDKGWEWLNKKPDIDVSLLVDDFDAE